MKKLLGIIITAVLFVSLIPLFDKKVVNADTYDVEASFSGLTEHMYLTGDVGYARCNPRNGEWDTDLTYYLDDSIIVDFGNRSKTEYYYELYIEGEKVGKFTVNIEYSSDGELVTITSVSFTDYTIDRHGDIASIDAHPYISRVNGTLDFGHNWGAPTYKWSDDNSKLTATRVCQNDPDHIETKTVNTTVSTVPSTCTQPGKMTYTANFLGRNNHFSKQTKEIEIPVDTNAHDWNKPTYVWSADHSKVTATRVCKNDPDHKETETANVTVTVIKEASCYIEGELTRTAVFSNPGFETQTLTDTIPALEHEWSDWTITKQPTTTEEGIETHTCNHCKVTEEHAVDKITETADDTTKRTVTPDNTEDTTKRTDVPEDTDKTAKPDTTPEDTGKAAKRTDATDDAGKTVNPVTVPEDADKTVKPVTIPDGTGKPVNPVIAPDNTDKTADSVTVPDSTTESKDTAVSENTAAKDVISNEGSEADVISDIADQKDAAAANTVPAETAAPADNKTANAFDANKTAEQGAAEAKTTINRAATAKDVVSTGEMVSIHTVAGALLAMMGLAAGIAFFKKNKEEA